MVLLRAPCHIIREHQPKGKGIQEVLIVTLIWCESLKNMRPPFPFLFSNHVKQKVDIAPSD